MISETGLIVRYAETDRMGIVHHSVYPVWFEAGRTEFIKTAGMRYSELEERGIQLPLLSLSCRYDGYAKYEDEITVVTSIKSLSPTRVAFEYSIHKNKESKVIVSGETEHVWTDKNLKPINLKKHYPELYKLFEGLKFHAGVEGKGEPGQ